MVVNACAGRLGSRAGPQRSHFGVVQQLRGQGGFQNKRFQGEIEMVSVQGGGFPGARDGCGRRLHIEGREGAS